jgi:hypothetical protein
MMAVMAHFPVNHQLQPLYRALAGLCGLYVLIFGIAGVVMTGHLGFFAQEGLPWVLGLRANRAFGILSIVAGAILIGGAVIGGRIAMWINLIGSFLFLGAGFVMLCVLRTGLNYLGFSMSTCIVSFIIGLVLFTAAMYGRIGTHEEVLREEGYRHGNSPDPMGHVWQPEHHSWPHPERSR